MAGKQNQIAQLNGSNNDDESVLKETGKPKWLIVKTLLIIKYVSCSLCIP